VRSKSKAAKAGLCEGDEVVSINGTPCGDLTYAEVIVLMESLTDVLQMLIKRSSNGINETLSAERENGKHHDTKNEDYRESTTLQINTAKERPHGDLCITEIYSETHQGAEESNIHFSEMKQETTQSHRITPKAIGTSKVLVTDEVAFREKTEESRPGTMVELQLSLSNDAHKGTNAPAVTLSGAEKCTHSGRGPSVQDGTSPVIAIPLGVKEGNIQWSSKVVQFSSGKEVKRIQGAAPSLPRVEVILDCSDREKEAPRSLAERGCVDSQVEGGQSEAPPSLLSFAISPEGTEQGEDDQHSERDHRPLKHRARHARLRRSESLSEKQVKEAKSKCKSIALLLTAPPIPNSKGVLMFKKRRQRARKYTLVSYGTGELERDEDEGEEGEGEEDKDKENTFEVSLLATSESEIDEDFFSDIDNDGKIVTFDWDSGLLEVEKKAKSGDEMQTLPETTGKGALMFAKRRQRMDQITAEQEEMKARTVHTEEQREVAMSENFQKVSSSAYQTKEEEMSRQQTCVSKSYTDMSQNHSKMVQQNGFGLAPDTNLSFQSSAAQKAASLNKTAKPFLSGVQNRAAAPFSPIRNVTSPLSDIPAPPAYCSISPPPEAFYRPVSAPVASRAAPTVWSPSEPTEHIASRDERIAVPAKRTGILQEAKRRSTSKPMFSFKEAPKVSPNPALLSLVHNAEGKKGTGAGFESGPEEDYLSLGAEACNFMQTQASKQKAPPPVAPKPSLKVSPTAGTPVSPVWSPSAAASNKAPSFPAPASPQAAHPPPLKSPQYPHSPVHPPSTLDLAGPFKGPQATLASPNHPPKTPITPSAGETKPPFEMPPAMSGKGAQLFARRHSRMEKYVVDSETVQANMARASSPTPSLPASWKYSSNVRAPPPVAYNPIHCPSYPPAASKPSSKSTAATKNTKRKPKKGLNALDIMKHQPYQLDASLFTFQPPSTKESLAIKQTSKLSTSKQALPLRPPSAGSPTNIRASSVYSVPAYGSQPLFQPNASIPVNESYSPTSYSAFSKPETATSSLAPRPKFSAKKAGVIAQERSSGRSLSLPGRPSSFISRAMSPSSPLIFQPAPDYFGKPDTAADRPGKRLTPWEAAARSPLGLVDEAFGPQNMQESIAANVVSAARRKTLPEPPDEWKQKVSSEPPAPNSSVALLGGKQSGIVSAPKSSLSVPSTTTQVGSQLQYPYCSQRSRTDPDIMSMDSKSDYCLSTADSNYNPQPRGWRRPT
ncbi:SYNP2 protein, partial [Pedionomus torquatus]|nr:SYNP2 protein [Pedionomus torquatus]